MPPPANPAYPRPALLLAWQILVDDLFMLFFNINVPSPAPRDLLAQGGDRSGPAFCGIFGQTAGIERTIV